MSRVPHPIDPASRSQGPARFTPEMPLPLRATDFDSGLAHLLHDALQHARRTDILNGLCRHLARILHLRLVVLARSLPSGTFALEGASSENAVWLELQHIPERWDDGLSSRGPAGESVRAQAAVHMRTADEGFALWRASADAEHVREILALPVPADDGTRVLELFFDGALAHGASSGTLTAAQLVHRVAAFLADLRAIERQQLLADALTSAGNAALVTDLEGTIVWSNPAFSALSGYSAEEVAGRNPSLLRSGHQGVRYYRDLWGTIRAGEVWDGETVDRAKNGETYSIRQTVSPVSQGGRVTHYVSIQQDIGRQTKERTALELASRLDPGTGLLTHAAFEAAARQALTEADHDAIALVLVSLRGLQRAGPLGEDVDALVSIALGKRVHDAVALPDLAGSWGPYEYALLLRGEVSDARVRARMTLLLEKLNEPLPYAAASLPALDVHSGIALAGQDTSFEELRLRADRQLADEPYRRANRETH